MTALDICLVCGKPDAQRCQSCRDAAYCSIECQQVDWRTHKLLCRSFAQLPPKPSATHVLVIHFPVAKTRPRLLWVDSEEDEYTKGYFNPCLDHLLTVPAATGYVGRALFVVRGNQLRQRPNNLDTLNIWYLDDFQYPNLPTNKSIHGTTPTLIGDTWGEFIWKGPIVAVLKQGRDFDPHLLQDITFTAYRDSIDFLGYYRNTYGSMIDSPGAEAHLARRILQDRARKVKGVRINSPDDQIKRQEDALVLVDVPKTHPLFNLEGDDPFCIPDHLGFTWVAKRYPPATFRAATGPEDNPLARLLLLQAGPDSKVWGGVHSWWEGPIGSVLVVDRHGGNISVQEVRAMCSFIEKHVVSLIANTQNYSLDERRRIWDAITTDNFELFSRSSEFDIGGAARQSQLDV